MNSKEFAELYLKEELRFISNSERINNHTDLTLYEKALIFKYSEDGYEELNQSLLSNKGNLDTTFGKLLFETLDKLPDYKGIVYRGVKLNKKQIKIYQDSFKNGELVIEHPFLSTSKSRMVAQEYKKNCLFIISSKTGKDIERIAKYGTFNPPNEKEVLFKTNTKFKVLDIVKEKDLIEIILEENE
jgi:hypothetical protein